MAIIIEVVEPTHDGCTIELLLAETLVDEIVQRTEVLDVVSESSTIDCRRYTYQ